MQVIDDTPTTLKTQRATIETESATVEQKLADRIAELAELNAVIGAMERRQGSRDQRHPWAARPERRQDPRRHRQGTEKLQRERERELRRHRRRPRLSGPDGQAVGAGRRREKDR